MPHRWAFQHSGPAAVPAPQSRFSFCRLGQRKPEEFPEPLRARASPSPTLSHLCSQAQLHKHHLVFTPAPENTPLCSGEN